MPAANAPSERLKHEKNRVDGADLAGVDREALEELHKSSAIGQTTKALYSRCLRTLAAAADESESV